MDAAGWDARYAAGQQWSTEPNRLFADVVDGLGLAPGRAVDLGCGEGRNAVWLATNGWRVTGVDFSGGGIERGRRWAAERGAVVDWVVADLRDWPVEPGSFDLVAVVYVHWPTAERDPWLRRVVAAVAPGGAFVLVGHDRTNIEHGVGGPRDPDVLSTPDELRALATEGGLAVERAETVLRPVHAEGGHGGEGATTRAAAIDHVVVARRPG